MSLRWIVAFRGAKHRDDRHSCALAPERKLRNNPARCPTTIAQSFSGLAASEQRVTRPITMRRFVLGAWERGQQRQQGQTLADLRTSALVACVFCSCRGDGAGTCG